MITVKQTETYKDTTGECIVCRGKLILISTNEEPIGLCRLIKDIGKQHFNSKKGDFGILKNIGDPLYWRKIKPIIISEREEIGVDDYCLINNEIIHKVEDNFQLKHKSKKILALPEQFSPTYLQAIIDGKLKNGDEVFVRCLIHDEEGYPRKISLRSNYIELFPINKKQTYTEEEVRRLVVEGMRDTNAFIIQNDPMKGQEARQFALQWFENNKKK